MSLIEFKVGELVHHCIFDGIFEVKKLKCDGFMHTVEIQRLNGDGVSLPVHVLNIQHVTTRSGKRVTRKKDKK